MDSQQFVQRFERYTAEAASARAQDKHHDFRRQLFLSFLADAFGISSSDVDVEQFIQLRGQRVAMKQAARVRKGWIDAVFGDLIFEFKRDLKKEEADGLRELNDYLSNIPNGEQSIGILTDGLKFVTYVLDDAEASGLRKIDTLDLEKVPDPEVARLWLDAYLLRDTTVTPSSEDIVRRFGLASPTFVTAARVLRHAHATFSATESGASEVKRQQWAFHLARVYGSADARNDEMFVRHTYLCQFAKILAYTTRFGVEEAILEIEGVIAGSAFEKLGVNNIGEQDFFAWVLAAEVKNEALVVFRSIAASLVVYDLRRIDEDLLKQLYQNLVEPETRHELGEFYTPDWLAELTLREISYGPGKSLLDPACGSGTFLFTALRLLAEQGLTGDALVAFALENVMGTDVHPLAVTVARINYMLAILPHLQVSEKRLRRTIPVWMANSLQMPNTSGPIEVITIPIEEPREFQIPVAVASKPEAFGRVLDEMQRRAEHEAGVYPNISAGQFGEYALKQLPVETPGWSEDGFAKGVWGTNLRYLTEQIAKGRDTIWAYVLRNTCQPLLQRQRKFDVVVGNPPWIAYRYLQDASYRKDVKTLVSDYGLLDSGETKLNTQIELSSVFFEHCLRTFLKLDGTIAFVMPRSAITGAKQHRAFQQKGFSRILDFKDVSPLFNVPTCVLVRASGEPRVESIPTTRYAGRLPSQECRLETAQRTLQASAGEISFGAQADAASPHYYSRVKQGATLVPRNLVFVTSAQPGLAPGQLAHTSIMRTDPDVDAEAKVPWKGRSLQGHIDDDFLYATLLSKNLTPFGVRRLHLVALPVRVGTPPSVAEVPGETAGPRYIPMSSADMRDSITFAASAEQWFEPAERMWCEHRKTVELSLWGRFNYQQGVVAQSPAPAHLVVYNAAGSNIASAVLQTGALSAINGARPQGFVLDHTAYWYWANSADEAHYLSALLNAPSVDAAIKSHQTQGLFGARHIHRRPFEVCAIQEFDASDPDHLHLATLSREAHERVAALDLSQGGVVAARKKARDATRDILAAIDAIAQRLLHLAPAASTATDDNDNDSDDADERDEATDEPDARPAE